MDLFTLKIESWDQIHYAEISDFPCKIGDQVVVQFDAGQDLAIITGQVTVADEQVHNEIRKIIKLAELLELNTLKEKNSNNHKTLDICRDIIQRYNLPMKLVDCHYSLDGHRLIIGFISDGRVDFRELVKDLSNHFKKTIRLQQIGIRDEAQICGDVGPCGCVLCCKRFLKQLTSITSDFAKIQGIEHRGCDRLSGSCGRLKCCLGYELDFYKELSVKMPNIGSRVKTKNGQGIVQNYNLLKQTVSVQLESKNVIEVDLKHIHG